MYARRGRLTLQLAAHVALALQRERQHAMASAAGGSKRTLRHRALD